MIFDPDMTSVKPYFIKAIHQWVVDNNLTPQIVLDANFPGVIVPAAAIENDKVILNVSFDATQNLEMDDETISFNARFSGVSHAVIIPMEAVSAIYARENGKGMMFEIDDEFDETEPSDNNHKNKPTNHNKSHLKLVD